MCVCTIHKRVPHAPIAIAQEERVIDWTVVIWVLIASLVYERLSPSGVVNMLVPVEVVVKERLVCAAPLDLHLDVEEVAQGHHERGVFQMSHVDV